MSHANPRFGFPFPRQIMRRLARADAASSTSLRAFALRKRRPRCF